MAVILGDGSAVERMEAAPPGRRCSLCSSRLTPPYVAWHWGKSLFFCGHCSWIEGGLSRDFQEVKARRAMQDMGFDGLSRQCKIRGKLLYTTENNNEN